MADSASEKTEKATPKKRKDARKEGQVLMSMEVNVAFCSAIMFALLLISWEGAVNRLAKVYQDFLTASYITDINTVVDSSFLSFLYTTVLIRLVSLLIPVMATAMVAGILINILQVGFMFTTKPLMPKLNKINPISGFKRLFSSRSVTQLLKSLLKIVCVGYVLYREYMALLNSFPTLIGTNIYTSLVEIMKTAFIIALKMCMVLAIIAAFDYLYQWWKFEKDLKMTKQEVKEEYKSLEGDPQIKGKIKQKQRQMSTMRMMEQVPQADVVITNPTHYAVALKYEEGKSGAPLVIAKGQDYLAMRIKEAAREHSIEIVENKPLAQSLFAMCEIGDEIPPELYKAVADILVYVYRLKNGSRRS